MTSWIGQYRRAFGPTVGHTGLPSSPQVWARRCGKDRVPRRVPSTDISQITSRFAEIIPPYHRRENCIPFAANRCLILEISPRLEAHLPRFSAIQTHPSCRFHLAVDVPGLRRSGSWSQIIDQPHDFPKQATRHRNLGQLERDVAVMADHLGTDLHQLLPQRGQRPVLDLLRQRGSRSCTTRRSRSAPPQRTCWWPPA